MFLEGYLPQLLSGALVTIEIALSALCFGLLLGIIGAAGEMSQNTLINKTTLLITSIFRGLPELLILFALYFGVTALLSQLFGHYVEVSAFTAGFIGLSLIFGSYATQTLRGACLAVPYGQLEAGQALGLSRSRVFIKLLLPQAFRHALPGLGNLWLVLLKDSALVALIGLSDLMNKTQLAATSTRKPFTFFFTAALMYLVATSISQLAVNRMSHRR